MYSLLTFKHDRHFRKVLMAIGMIAIAALIISFFVNSDGLHMHKIVPWVSTATILKGLKTARKAYKAGKGIRTALKFVGSWTVVSLVISMGGDWLIGQLLNGNLKSLASW